MPEYIAGSASVAITPDLSSFQTDVKAKLAGLDGTFAEAGTSAGKSFSTSFQDELKGAFANLPDATVKADADTTAADGKLAELVRARTAAIDANADTAAASAKLDAAAKTRTATIKVNVDGLDKVSGLVSGKTLALGGAGLALAPTGLAGALGLAGIGTAFAGAAADATAFGVVAKGMFSDVTTAQKALTTAQKQYNTATTDAGRAKALAAEKAALDGLSPSEKQLATQLTAVTAGWSNLNKAEQPVVAGALAPWLKTATDGMSLLSPLIEDGAGAIGLLGQEADKAIKSPFWNVFAGDLGATGQVALTDFGEAAGKLGDGLAHLFVTFAPDIASMLQYVPQLAGDFDQWARNVNASGLEDFFSKVFSPANVAALKSDGENLENLLKNAATAAGQMSGSAFTGLTNVLDVMGHLTPAEIEALTGLFLTIKGISAVSSGINAVSSFLDKAKSAAGKVTGLFGTTADAEAEGAAAGKAAGSAAYSSWKTSFDPWAASAGFEAGAEGAGTAAGEAAGLAFNESFTAAVEKGGAGSFLAIEAAEGGEAKALGSGLGAEAGSAASAAEREAAGTTVIPGSVVKEGEEGAAAAAKKAPKGFDTGGILGAAGPVAILATGLQQGAGIASSFVSKPGTSEGKAAGNIQHAQSQVTGIPGGTGPGSPGQLATGFEGFASVTVPRLWSQIYTGFENEVGSPVAAWFTNSLPNAFTSALPRLAWSPAYEGFENTIGSPVAAWFTNSLPNAFTSAIPRLIWSPAYEGFENEIGSPIASFFTTSLPGFFSGAQSWLQGAGADIGHGLETGWNATEGGLTTAFNASKNWVTGAFNGAVGWLNSTGHTIEGGLSTGWNATASTVTTDFGKAKNWITSQFSSAESWLTGSGKNAGQGLGSGFSAEQGFINSTAAKAKSWVTSALPSPLSWLVNTGISIVQGLANGITGSGGLITSAVSHLASLVPSSIKSLLGIASPSKVTHQLGVFTGQGFGLGLGATESFVGQSAGTLARTTVGALAGMASAQSLAALGVPSAAGGTRLPGVGSPVSGSGLQMQVSYAGSSDQLTNAVVGSLRFSIQAATGGDVQAHLGYGPVR